MGNKIEVCKVEKYVAIDKLKLHPDNPRTIQPDRLLELKDSITEKGFYQPILVWKKGGIVLSGNHRLIACRELIEEGWEFVGPNNKKNVLPVVIEDVSDEVAKAILYEANNTYAEWIEDRLAQALEEVERSKISSYGFTQDYVDKLLASALKDAEKVIKRTEESLKDNIPTYKEDKEEIDIGLASVEEFESLILPKYTYDRLMEIIEEISAALDPEWREGDSVVEAVEALYLFYKNNGLGEAIVEEINND